MKCPYCNAEMELGHIEQYRVPMTWYSNEKEDKVFFSIYKTIKLSPRSGDGVKVHHCDTCKKFIIDEKNM